MAPLRTIGYYRLRNRFSRESITPPSFLFSGAGASFARDANKVGPPRENAVLQGCDQRVEGMSMNPIGSPLVLAVKVKVISTIRSYPELEDGRDAEADTV